MIDIETDNIVNTKRDHKGSMSVIAMEDVVDAADIFKKKQQADTAQTMKDLQDTFYDTQYKEIEFEKEVAKRCNKVRDLYRSFKYDFPIPLYISKEYKPMSILELLALCLPDDIDYKYQDVDPYEEELAITIVPYIDQIKADVETVIAKAEEVSKFVNDNHIKGLEKYAYDKCKWFGMFKSSLPEFIKKLEFIENKFGD